MMKWLKPDCDRANITVRDDAASAIRKGVGPIRSCWSCRRRLRGPGRNRPCASSWNGRSGPLCWTQGRAATQKLGTGWRGPID